MAARYNAELCVHSHRLAMPAVTVAPLQIGHLTIDPPILQAPMAGFTNYAFRQMVRDYGGVGLQATEMISARGFAWMDVKRQNIPIGFGASPKNHGRLPSKSGTTSPRSWPRWAGDSVDEYRVSVVDINFGCPVRQVTQRAKSGSYLLSTPDRMGEIIERVVRACAPDARHGKDPPGLHSRQDQRQRDCPGRGIRRCCGAHRARSYRAGFFQRYGRLGPHRRDQTTH